MAYLNSGGTPTTDGLYTVHKFLLADSGTNFVCGKAGNVAVLVVAGGGGGGGGVVLELNDPSTHYIVRSLELTFPDPGSDTIEVQLYKDGPFQVNIDNPFTITTGGDFTAGTYNLMDMFGLPDLAAIYLLVRSTSRARSHRTT